MDNRKVAAIVMLIVMALVALTPLGHCSTTSQKHDNSLGVVQYNDNPNISVVGSFMGGEVHRDSDGRIGVNIRLHPKYTYNLFDESILFCGDISGMFEGKGTSQYQTWTYRRAASRIIDGIPCHTLVGLDDVKDDQTLQMR